MAQSEKKLKKIRRRLYLSLPVVRFYSLKIMTGSDLSGRRLPMMEIISRHRGPVVWLTSGIHGDEVGSTVITQEVFKILRKEKLKHGAVYAFPLMNPIGFENVTRSLTPTEEDLNRAFPGHPQGTLAERIAHKIFTTITATKPTLVLDLHNDWSNSIPYTLIDPYPGFRQRRAYAQSKMIGFRLGLPLVDEEEEEAGDNNKNELKKTLSGSLLNRGIPALTLELGGAYLVKEPEVRTGVAAVLRVLASLDMIDPGHATLDYKQPAKIKGKILHYSRRPLASTSGIIRYLIRPGEILEPGTPLARVYNVFGRLQETLTADRPALVLGHADMSVALPGSELVALGVF